MSTYLTFEVMKFIIETTRCFQIWPSYHLIYEWEDNIRDEVPNAYLHKVSGFYEKYIIFFSKYFNLAGFPLDKNIHFYFEMSAKHRSDFYNRRNIIPCIIDFFLEKKDIDKFEKAHSRNPFVLISSLEVYKLLKSNACKLNIYHWPLSVSDKYKINEDTQYNKKYDFVLVGRQNTVLKEYLEQYARLHPNLIYVLEGEDKFHYYTNDGGYVGYFKSREDYIQLMKMSRIGMYSTPSIDNSRTDGNGFNQVTPKFLEYLASGCWLIMRYPDNPDTKYYELPIFSPHIDTYKQFEERVNMCLTTKPNMKIYSDYLANHYTSKRVELLKIYLKKNNIYNE